MRHYAPRLLHEYLQRLFPVKRFWIAYSGGLDSTVLLQSLAFLKSEFRDIDVQAVHVNHGLHVRALQWARWCTDTADRLDIPCRILTINVEAGRGSSREAQAREARYRALAELVKEGDCLLTAHHQDDQAETVLLQLLRGAGVHGLAAMPLRAKFSNGFIARPLLDFTRTELRAYAEASQLDWIDDPANFEIDYDRNFLRHHILPLLKDRWPSLSATLSRSADHCAAARHLIDDVAAGDLRTVGDTSDGTLVVERLRTFGEIRQANLLRFWLRQSGSPVPSQTKLAQILHQALTAAPDRQPCVKWRGAEVRRYRNKLYALTPEAARETDLVLPWDMRAPLTLPFHGRQLMAIADSGRGLSARLCQSGPVTIRFRRGGEKCKPAGQQKHRMLKKLFQERGIPVWERDRLPLLYVGEQLAAVADCWVCEPFHAAPYEPSVRLEMRNRI